MVSKCTTRRTLPVRHNNSNRRRHRNKSPIKNVATAATVVAASINKSIFTCHRRLIKIFTKLVRITTPKKSSRKKGYQILKKFAAGAHDHINNISALRRTLFPATNALPPLISLEKRTVFLDLDETLVHSQSDPAPEKYDFIVRPIIDGKKVNFYVLKRPFVEEFLENLSKNYEIVVYTAGIEEYASLVLDRLDWKGLISHRLYRDSCKQKDGMYTKDLSELGRDLSRVVIVDDNPNCYRLQPENAIRIIPFVDDMEDGELRKLLGFFDGDCNGFDDMRDAVKQYFEDGRDDKV